METGTRKIEMHQLDLRYDHTRIYKRSALNRLHRSIESYGQISPVVVVPASEDTDRLVLIDGYLRHKALRMCGKDTLTAVISEYDERTTLLRAIAGNAAKRWEAIEEASLLNELTNRFEMSLGDIAKQTGRDKSWVKRRLDLVRSLPEKAFDALKNGVISTWAASRIVVPLARANGEHGDRLIAHLKENPLSTRELAAFFEHYQKANRKVRSRMIDDPTLFVKASRMKEVQREAAALCGGPEEKWLKDLKTVYYILLRLRGQVGTVSYPGQEALLQKEITESLTECRTLFDYIAKEVARYDKARHPGGDPGIAPEGYPDHEDLPTPERVAEHGPVGGPGQVVARDIEGIGLHGTSSPRQGVVQGL